MVVLERRKLGHFLIFREFEDLGIVKWESLGMDIFSKVPPVV